MTDLIGITGATGELGKIVVQKLRDKVPASSIVALVRDTNKAEGLGVASRAADYSKPDTLDAALSGVSTLLLISSNEIGKREAQHANVIAAAKKAGVKNIVYTSRLRADTTPLPLAPEHKATEAALTASGLTYTILRNGWYYENNLADIGATLARGALFGGAGEGRISFATREDFAEAAAAVLSTKGHDNATYELGGDIGYTLSELAAEIAKQSGRPVVYKNLPEDEFATVLKSFGFPDWFAVLIANCDTHASQGALFTDDRTLSKLIGRPTTPLSQAVTQALASQ